MSVAKLVMSRISAPECPVGTAPTTIFATSPGTISPMSICVMVTIRASSLVGAMSPKPTVAKTVTVK
jgi:hypothetical protein